MTIRPLVDLLDVTKRGETSPTVSEQILIRVRCLYIMYIILLTGTNPCISGLYMIDLFILEFL